MGYIPPNTKWYLADLIMCFRIGDSEELLVHANLHLIRADSPEEAYKRSVDIGRESEAHYTNSDGQDVSVSFRGLRDLFPIYDELKDGAEILYEEIQGLDEDGVAKLVTPKEELSVFGPRPLGPDDTRAG